MPGGFGRTTGGLIVKGAFVAATVMLFAATSKP